MNRLRTAYLILANTAVLLLLVQAGSHVANLTLMRAAPGLSYRQLSNTAKQTYRHMAVTEVDDLLSATARLRFQQRLGVLIEAPMKSRFLNIDEHGVRSNGVPHRELAIDGAIWLFGGSTALGIGVADHETIAAHLARLLQRPVINLGVRGHSAAAENRLGASYLEMGHRPGIAAFLDGVNEGCDLYAMDDRINNFILGAESGYRWSWSAPVVRLYQRISTAARRAAGGGDPPLVFQPTCVALGRHEPLATLHGRILSERAALCAAYAVECRTFVQPFAGVHGRHDDPAHRDSADAVYHQQLFQSLEHSWRRAGAIFVTGALDEYPHHAFVDHEHYSAEAGRLVAEAMARALRKNHPGISQ